MNAFAQRHYAESFDGMGQYLVAVIEAADRGLSGADNRLEYRASSGLEGGLPSAGGFLIPVEQAIDLHTKIYDTGEILSRCHRWPATKEVFRVPMIDETSRANGSRFGGVTMAFVDEGEAITASQAKFARREMSRRKLAGLVYCTNEMLEDVPTLAASFERLYSMEATFVLEREIVNGTGANGPLGIINAAATIEVGKESGQSADTVVAANVVNMFARLWSASKSRAVWLVNSNIAGQLYGLVWATGTGVVPLFRWSDTGQPLLMGRPVIETEYNPTLGDAGDIILADLGEYMVADIDGADLSFSGDVRFVNDESAFRVRMRVDGQPAWATPTTPLNGSATTSPFVTLASRA